MANASIGSKRRILLVILWISATIWLLLALGLSSQTGEETGNLSCQIAEFLGRLLGIPETSMESFHSGLRTAAHVVVYFVFAALICGATLATFPSHRSAWLAAAIICIAIAICDEYRKAFIPGRHCTWREAGLNVLGCVLRAVSVWTVYKAINIAKRL